MMLYKRKKNFVAHDIQKFIRNFFPDLTISALDVGARGGLNSDLCSISPLVDYYGFEPDPDEYKNLVEKDADEILWRSVKYIPYALYSEERKLTLNLYRQRGCSSVLEADKEKGKQFGRGEYYIQDGRVNLSAKPLDLMIEEYNISNPAYMKIDVQGLEIECFKGARRCLSDNLVAVRTEVSFLPIYKGQPLFAEVDQYLRTFGFVPMRFLEFHEWRRDTKIKYPHFSKKDIPISYGQMIHGDVLYMRSPESYKDNIDIENLIRLGLIALCYEHYDQAMAAFSHPALATKIGEKNVQILRNAIISMSHKSLTMKRRLYSYASKLGFV